MEEIVAVLLGTGAIVFSPFLIPGLRPVAKSAIKGGMAVADAAKGVAAATSEGCREVVNKAGAVLKPAGKTGTDEVAVAADAVAADAVETGAVAADADATAGAGTAGAHQGSPIALNLAPVVDAIVKGGHMVADAAAGIMAQAGKQWSQIVADAQAERKGETAPVADEPSPAVPVEAVAAPAGATEVPGATTVAGATAVAGAIEVPSATTVAGATTVPSAPAEASAAAAEQPDDLQQIDGIGPKVAAVLREAGITSFEQLAGADPEQLRAVLVGANPRYRMFDPTPWPAAARRLVEARSN